MSNYRDNNLIFWNELAEIHEKSLFYDVSSFMAGRQALHDIELKELPDVQNKSLLHLQCHFGMDTLSWARLGARVTGVDFSDKAIALAQKLNSELKLDARFIQSDIYHLPERLDEKFDIVFTSYGVLPWLDSLQKWAGVIQHFLKPGGTFLIVEDHPLLWIMGDNCTPSCLRVGYHYFNQDVVTIDDPHSYATATTKIKHSVRYEWTHTLADILSSVLGAGLQIISYNEYPFSAYQRFEWLVQDQKGWWRMPEGIEATIPMLFSLRAEKPL